MGREAVSNAFSLLLSSFRNPLSAHRKDLSPSVDPYDWEVYQLARVLFVKKLKDYDLFHPSA